MKIEKVVISLIFVIPIYFLAKIRKKIFQYKLDISPSCENYSKGDKNIENYSKIFKLIYSEIFSRRNFCSNYKPLQKWR